MTRKTMDQIQISKSPHAETASDEAVLACPECGGGVLRGRVVWQCTRCGTPYPSLPGLVRINPSPHYSGELSHHDMLEVLDCAQRSSWIDAVTLVVKKTNRALAQQIIGKAAGDWFFEVPRKDGMRVLIAASGWGELTFYLARHVKEVYSLEGDVAKSEFQRIRRQQEQTDNVIIVNSDEITLPFRDESFDLIAINGTLGWLGSTVGLQRRKDALLCYLARIRRLLKPAGCMYLAGKNRGSWSNRRNHKNSADPLACTPRGYRSLLRKAGFDEIHISWVLPDTANPFQSARFENARALRFFARTQPTDSLKRRGGNAILRAATRCKAHKFIMPSLSIVSCAKSSKHRSLLESICEQLRQRGMNVYADDALRRDMARVVVARRNRYLHLTNAKWILFDRKTRRPVMIVKVPRRREGAEWIRREERIFGEIAGRFPRLSESRKALYMQVEDTPIMCERFFHGKTFREHLRSPAAHRSVINWLVELQQSAPSETRIAAQQELFHSLEQFFTHNDIDAPIRTYLAQWADAVSHLDGEPVRCVPVHGDFTPGNIFLSRNEVFITDWEWAQTEGYPWFDFWALELSCSLGVSPDGSTNRIDPANTLASLEGTSPQSDLITLASREFLNKTALPRNILLGGLLWTIIWRIRRELELYGIPPHDSRYYQLLSLAAGDNVPLWDCAESIVAPSRTDQPAKSDDSCANSRRETNHMRLRGFALDAMRRVGVVKLSRHVNRRRIPILMLHGIQSPRANGEFAPL
ncbi:MAG: methyltransferase domain-containing protein, partial [Planctomycetota bacterium]